MNAAVNLTNDELYSQVKQGPLPGHVAIIMDGNGRWAEKLGLPRIKGHHAGMESVREVVTLCADLKLQALTLYAFSAENWRRPGPEVSALMTLLQTYLKKEVDTMMDNDIRFRTIGRLDELPAAARKWVQKTVDTTAGNRGMILNLALSYGGRVELTDAVKKIAESVRDGRLDVEEINEELISNTLDTAGLPDPDLMIRTSGEHRISNFLLWQLAYSELYFTNVLWPDFRRRDMLLAIRDYQKRERRFGRITQQLATTVSSVGGGER
ncbi:MAG: isoprenyl transferase [Nitrospirota bacterium]|nr:isoprenyl transferase [Nitrospirota bacterium]